ncbi:hypothetical protein AMTRI_Chr13g92300 [Amborella trichopoda]|uniref:Uncharacterized protein n=1 Tax=Amborella trichopoda TaxID=13333 RepID=U5CW96_AMBTC|nr:UPF0496 protein 1 [Amborella trichopoda]ERN17581.1 hypothetical protein AMTR_s00059p00142910 [Amborella trichopoda]|eukprot:XP_006856114.1 UPF0496 protein 1 [Amborella trichopoda]
MGGKMSKNGNPSAVLQFDGNLQYVSELFSYEEACKLDPELEFFDSNLQAQTKQAINKLAVGVEVRSLSVESLKDVISCLLEMNQEVVKVILERKQDIWKSPELFDLVEEYFNNSLQTMDFCTALEKCLKRAKDGQMIIQVALQQFAEAGEGHHQKTLEELRSFKMAASPFTEEFFTLLQSVYSQQVSMLKKLVAKKSKLDKKLKSIKVWRRVSSIIFASVFATVLICSVVAAAVAAPPVAAALAAASAIPIGSAGKWVDSLWKNYEVALKSQKEVINSMHVGAYVAIKDLDNIRVLVDRLEIEIGSLLQNVDFALQAQDAIKLGIEEITKKFEVFTKSIEDLDDHATRCHRDIQRARTVVLQKIIKHPS